MTDGPDVHRYAATCSWRGSTGAGYDAYSRAHEVSASPADATLALTADPAFRGVPGRLNPEQLLLAAASSCQLLSFLAVAARARIDVVEYRDEATAEMPETPPSAPTWLQRIVLRPAITLRDGPSDERLRRLVDLAHRECFVANSLRSEIKVTPAFVRV